MLCLQFQAPGLSYITCTMSQAPTVHHISRFAQFQYLRTLSMNCYTTPALAAASKIVLQLSKRSGCSTCYVFTCICVLWFQYISRASSSDHPGRIIHSASTIPAPCESYSVGLHHPSAHFESSSVLSTINVQGCIGYYIARYPRTRAHRR